MSFISAASGSDNAVATNNIGDLLLVFSHNDTNNTIPSLVAGFDSKATGTGGNNAARVSSRIATSVNEDVGTWTDATSVIVLVYRDATGTLSVGSSPSVVQNGFGTLVNFDTVTMDVTDGTSWVTGFVGHRSQNTDTALAPTGMTNRESYQVPGSAGGNDTNGGVTSWSNTTLELGGSAAGFTTITVELVLTLSSVIVTNITDPLNTNAQSTINGTGFEAVQGTGKVEQIQGAKSTVLVIDTWGDLQVLADSLNIESTLYNYGTHDLKVTADGGDSATTAFESVPAVNNDYVNITSLATVGDRLTAIPDLAASDQVRYQDFLYSGGSPTAYPVVVNADATFSVSGSTPEGTYTFEVKAWDSTDETWGVAANQTVIIGAGGVTPVSVNGGFPFGLMGFV